jgi:hypothetical protein
VAVIRTLAAVTLLTASVGTAASCQLALGSHEVCGEGLGCSEDADCDEGKRCHTGAGLCLKDCKGASDGTEQAVCGAFRECNTDTCTPPIGTPCDPEGLFGYCITCTKLDAQDEEVPGYCTRACKPSCPAGSFCTKDEAFCCEDTNGDGNFEQCSSVSYCPSSDCPSPRLCIKPSSCCPDKNGDELPDDECQTVGCPLPDPSDGCPPGFVCDAKDGECRLAKASARLGCEALAE